MIKFPKPFDWLQKKAWRLYWVELTIILWAIILFNMPVYHMRLDDLVVSSIFVVICPLFALPVSMISSKRVVHGLFKIIGALFLFPVLALPCDFKVGDIKPIHMVLDLLEDVLKFIGDLNSKHIISRFLIENPSKYGQGIYGGKIEGGTININANGGKVGEININSKNEINTKSENGKSQ